jgi:ClpP class serine protease
MSAGTMLACSCKEIIMAKHSSLGPIDPQYGGIPALDIVEEFESAKNDLTANPEQALYWKILLEKYPVAYYGKCKKAIQLSEDLVKSWLSQNMLKGHDDEAMGIGII